MAQTAEELLLSLTDEELEKYAAKQNPANEEHIVIGSDRFITVPDALKRIAVQFDHDVETVTFDCPRYWDGLDMSKMKIYINYMRADGKMGAYIAQNIAVDKDRPYVMHFDWTISNVVTEIHGDISFLVCIKKADADGNEKNHWNSELCEDMYVSEGMECQEILIKEYPDIITQLLVRMDYCEDIATPASMRKYIEDFLTTSPELPDTVKDIMYEYMSTHYPTTEDALEQYVSMYLDKHPPLIVVGPDEPPMACLWFNTSGKSGSGTSNKTIKLSAESPEDNIFAEVEDTTIPAYNFIIE